MRYASFEGHEYLLGDKQTKCLKFKVGIYRQVRG